MGAFKLGKMTLGSLFKKPTTLLYPFESKEPPAGLKGQIGINVQDCILCGMCQRGCTTGCLTVDKKEGFWQIDRYRCVQCGYCITVCPKTCLYMLPAYATVAPQKSIDRYDVPVKERKAAAKATEDDLKAPAAAAVAKAEVPSAAVVDAVAAQDMTDTLRDHQLEDLLALMDDERAARVRDALEGARKLP